MPNEFSFMGPVMEPGMSPFPDPLPKEPEPTTPPKPFVPSPQETQRTTSPCAPEAVNESVCDFSPEGMWGREEDTEDTGYRIQDISDKELGEDDKQTLRKIYAGLGIVVVVLVVAVAAVWGYLGKRVEEKKPADGDVEKNIAEEDAAENGMPQFENPNLIKAAEGGWIVSPEGFEIIIPSGALAQDAEIKVERVAEGAVTDLYHLMPDGLKFLKPVIVRIPYKESGFRRGQTPRDIALNYWSGEGALHAFSRSLPHSADSESKKLTAEAAEF